MLPASTMKVPATAFSSVDLPDPLVPITIRNELAGSLSDTSVSALTSFGVPGLNVFDMRSIASIGSRHLGERAATRLAGFQSVCHVRQDQRGKDKHRSDEFEVVGAEPPAQCDGYEQAK